MGWGGFDYFSSVDGVEIDDRAPRLTLCDADQAGIRDFYLIDKDSSLKPRESKAAGTSALISDHPNMLNFIPDGETNCKYISEGCYHYCEGACLRSITFSIDPSNTTSYQLRVCERDQIDNCIFLDGHSVEEGFHSSRFVHHGLHYRVALPMGRFDAAFVNEEGEVAWPKFVEEEYHTALCDNSVAYGAVWVEQPEPIIPLEEHCSQLIQNGDAEESDYSHPHWIAGPRGIQVRHDQGIVENEASSSAFCEIPIEHQHQYTATAPVYSFGQYVDSRCMIKDERYLVQAWVRVSTQTSTIQFDNEKVKFGVYFVEYDSKAFAVELDISGGASAIDGEQRRKQRNLRTRQDTLQEVELGQRNSGATWAADGSSVQSETGYRLLQGELRVTQAMARASSAFFYIQRNTADSDVTLCVDGISISRI